MADETRFRPVKGWLGAKVIPRTTAGDPDFKTMGQVYEQFTAAETLYLVNRALYAITYQNDYHRKRAADEAQLIGPVKRKVRELFGVGFDKATDEQLKQAARAVWHEQQDRETKEENNK